MTITVAIKWLRGWDGGWSGVKVKYGKVLLNLVVMLHEAKKKKKEGRKLGGRQDTIPISS